MMNLLPVAEKLDAAGFKGRISTDLALARFTTYRLGGPASLYVEPERLQDLDLLGETLASAGEGNVPILALGRGSNLVVSDHGFPGVVVRLGAAFNRIEPYDPPDSPGSGAVAGAATSMPQLANWAARRGLSGVEWMISIPGSVGGGVRMNAGAHGGEVKDVLASATVWDFERLATEERDVTALGYDYRRSALTGKDLVLEARFALAPGNETDVRERMEEHRRHRAATQPGALQNAGSVFKNPPGDSAGRLVEATGLKGLSVGGASVSELHANFFIAGQGATSQDVRDLVNEVRKRVKEHSGVDLQTEIRFIGAFTGEDES